VKRGFLISVVSCLIILVLIPFPTAASAQSGASAETHPRIVLAQLHDPVYPQLARLAHVDGDVELTLKLKQSGVIESVDAISGSPLLQQAAKDSAMQSQFECDGCTAASVPYTLVYTFQLGPAEPCDSGSPNSKNAKEVESFPKVTHEGNRVVLVDWAVSTCDAVGELHYRVRSSKCLYIWKCGDRIK